ncbi:hypothetical protein [Bradyrhizobium iriomotense]|uniref:hypothetical protein n=1 Tax=Bradyrhizobium iriomotense TaxID=441950 RepID=UPI003D9BAFED
MNRAAPNVGSTHATAVKATGAHAAAMKAATSTTASKRVIGHQAGSDEDSCRETNQTIANHELPPDGEAPSIRWLLRVMSAPTATAPAHAFGISFSRA